MDIKGQITILTNNRGTTIEIMDQTSRVTFVKVFLTPEQFCTGLGRLCNVPCEYTEIQGLDKVGKKLETKHMEFVMPNSNAYDKELAKSIASTYLVDGWEVYDSFSSQRSFFVKDGLHYAHCCIRRWV